MSVTTADWDDPDTLRARANLIGWKRNIEACYAKVGEAAGALDALREVRLFAVRDGGSEASA